MSHADVLQSDYCAEMLRVLADPDRLKIIDCLRAGEQNVGQIAERLNLQIVNVSHHLGVLRNAKVVVGDKVGRHVNYTLNPDFFHASTTAVLPDQIDLGCCCLNMPKS